MTTTALSEAILRPALRVSELAAQFGARVQTRYDLRCLGRGHSAPSWAESWVLGRGTRVAPSHCSRSDLDCLSSSRASPRVGENVTFNTAMQVSSDG